MICRTLFDDRFPKSFVTIDEDLESHTSVYRIHCKSVREQTYRFTLTKRDTNNVAIFLCPFGDLRDVTIA